MPSDLAVVILTFNEEIHLARAIASVRPIAGSIHVVDSGSTDNTVAIAESLGATVTTHRWKNYADQFQWGIDSLPTDVEWVMRLDADEVIESDLAARIAQDLPGLSPDVVGVNLRRRHIFMGRWIRFGGRYPLTLLRIFRRHRGHIEQRWMDEHIVVQGGAVVTIRGGFADHNLNDLDFFTDKHNKYATREAVDILGQKYGLFRLESVAPAESSLQAASKRWIKQSIYNRIPFQVSAPLYFLYRYVLRLGFLDGTEGLIYHFLQGYWYRFLVGAKVRELELALRDFPTPADKRRELSRLTGLRLDSEI